MSKFILSTLTLAALMSPLTAHAYPGEVRDDRRDVHVERNEVRSDVARGDYREAREDRRDLRDARDELRDTRNARFDGNRRGYDNRGWNGEHRGFGEHRGYGEYRGYDSRRYEAGRYYHPRNYAYRPWAVGAFLPRAYWGSQYDIGRPAFYGLPVGYGGARWVRVGPDALLIRERDGAVLRVERARFY